MAEMGPMTVVAASELLNVLAAVTVTVHEAGSVNGSWIPAVTGEVSCRPAWGMAAVWPSFWVQEPLQLTVLPPGGFNRAHGDASITPRSSTPGTKLAPIPWIMCGRGRPPCKTGERRIGERDRLRELLAGNSLEGNR